MKFAFVAILIAALASAKHEEDRALKNKSADLLAAQSQLYESLLEFDGSLLSRGEEDSDFELMFDEDARGMFGQGKGVNAKNLYAYGRAFDEYDEEAGWGEDFKSQRKEYKSDMPRYEKDDPLIQRFIDGREFVEGADAEEDDGEEEVLKADTEKEKAEREEKEKRDRELMAEFREARRDYKDTRPSRSEYLPEEAILFASENDIDTDGKKPWWNK